MKTKLAQIISAVLNPFLVGLALILLLSFGATATVGEAVKWSLMLVGISILPVFSTIMYLVRNDKMEGIFINIRRQRYIIYALAGVCNVIGYGLLIYFKAPLVLTASYVAALASVVVFMCINFFWKISLHAAFAAASVTMLTILYGSLGAITAVMIPPVGWSRIELKHHSLMQVVAGTLLSSVIVVVVFHFFGLIGNASL
jgi:membrane-associated phospholipid phosphatase